MRRDGSVWASIDWITFGLYLFIMLFGWLVVYAVQYGPETSQLFDFGGIHGKQLIWIIISLVIGGIILVFDSEFFPGFAWIIYGVIMVMLLAVMFFAREVNGARSWLEIGPMKIQPSEFAKYATALALAKYLSIPGVLMKDLRSRMGALAVLGLPMGLIILQGDMGSALVFTSFLIVLYREGFSVSLVMVGAYVGALFVLSLILPPATLHGSIAVIVFGIALVVLQRPLRKNRPQTLKLLLLLGAGMATLVSLAVLKTGVIISSIASILFLVAVFYVSNYLRKERRWVLIPTVVFVGSLFFGFFLVDFAFNDLLESHQQERILTLVGQSTNRDATYNVDQSKMTIASGGLTGKGFLQGTFTRYGHVPEQQTDFIFCTIGEEFGFLGSFLFLLAYLGLLVRTVLLAERQRSTFSRDFAYGVAGLFFVQITINVGMTIGLVPVIGIPLPFVSYGGSSVLAFSLLVFTMLRLDADRLMVLR